MDLAMSPTREQFPLRQRKILKKAINGFINWFIVFIILGFALGFQFLPGGDWAEFGQAYLGLIILGVAIFLALRFLLGYWYQAWYFAVYYYDLTDDHVVIRKGPITPREITVPYERIQDVYVDQDILDRLFGLYDVHLASATISSGMEAHIDGVDRQGADGLRAVLLQRIRAKLAHGRESDTVNPAN